VRYRAVVEVEDGRIWIYFGSGGTEVGVEIPRYKYLRRVRENILWALSAARELGVLEEVEE